MRRIIFLFVLVIVSQAICISLSAQKTVVTGTIKNSITHESVAAVSVVVKNRPEGTYSDDKGNIRLPVNASFPLTLVVSSIGYETREVVINNITETPDIQLKPASVLGRRIVVSATRTPTKLLESPVSIEQINSDDIQRAAVPNFYESIANLKGVDITTSGLAFRTVSTRGFNGSGNLRMNQFMDGMDNQAPGLNFSVGSLLAMSELDVDNIELLPGASSALYGSGGLNGTLLMNSKNPFKYQGLSFQVKEGIMHVKDPQRGASPYHNIAVRWAKAYSKFAFKVNAELIQAKDWEANDTANLDRSNVISKQKPGTRSSDPGYDGVNVYGDEVNADMYTTSQGILSFMSDAYRTGFRKSYNRDPTAAEINSYLANNPQSKGIVSAMKTGLIPKERVSRTGYSEKDLADYNTYNLKLSGGLYYKITNNIEASLTGNFGTGTTLYTNADRYALKGVHMGQYKAELKSKNWFLRAYTTQESAGQAYNTTALASYINESWKSSQQWFSEYIGNYAGARTAGLPAMDAHALARSKADAGRLVPGTAAFNDAFARIGKKPISDSGALFLDRTDLWQYDAQLNLSDKIKVVDVLVGASYKQYVLNSEGTLFADTAGRIRIPEWGSFIQLQKKLLHETVTLTASGRYDKSKNFVGQFTPRITALIKVFANNNIRLSYQSAYRLPAAQDQYSNVYTGAVTLIGALPEFATHYNFQNNPVYTAQSIGVYRNSFNPADLQKASFNKLKAEKVNSLELGYKGLIGEKLLIDFSMYFSRYKDFVGQVAVGQPQSAASYKEDLVSSFLTKNFAYVQNIDQNVNASGFGVGLAYKFVRGYTANINVSSDKIQDLPEGFISYFNTPAFRFNIGLGNERVWKQFGFNVNYRWQDKMNWESVFGTGIVPAYGSIDAQISYKMPGTKNLIKLGSSNLLNKYYRSAFGNPQTGGLYYLSFGFNLL